MTYTHSIDSIDSCCNALPELELYCTRISLDAVLRKSFGDCVTYAPTSTLKRASEIPVKRQRYIEYMDSQNIVHTSKLKPSYVTFNFVLTLSVYQIMTEALTAATSCLQSYR